MLQKAVNKFSGKMEFTTAGSVLSESEGSAMLAPTNRKTVVLSCFACSPLLGSEPGVGWRWALELSKRYRVIVLTHAHFRTHIELPAYRQLLSEPGRQLEFLYFVPSQFGLHPQIQLNSRVFYTWWQWRVRSVVRALCKATPVDLIHHLTWGTYRFPVFLGGLGPPLVLGPLGGGDVAPQHFYAGLPARERLREGVRALSLGLTRVDPFVQAGLAGAALIFCKTDETLHGIGARHRSRALVAPEIGAPEVPEQVLANWGDPLASSPKTKCVEPCDAPFKLLYAGRLLGMKGVVLLMATLKVLVAQGRQVQLLLAGDGPMRTMMEARVRELDIVSSVKFLGMLPRAELMDLYADADLFFFPSLHDSSGNVVLEAMSRALPVLCLDLGGPKHYVTPESAVVVTTTGLQLDEVVARFAFEITRLMDDRPRLLRMKKAAVAHAQTQTWASKVWGVYRHIERQFEWAE